jgi:hypothetical protein
MATPSSKIRSDLFSGANTHPVLGRGGRIGGDAHRLVDVGPLGLEILERQVERHELDQAGRRAIGVGVLRVDGAPLAVQEQDRLRAQRRRAAVLGSRDDGNEECRGENQCEDEAGPEHRGHCSDRPSPATSKKPVSGRPA